MTFAPTSAGGSAQNARALTAAATINAGDFAEFTVTAAATATMAATLTAGQRADVKNLPASTANVTIAVPSGATLDGVSNGTRVVTPGQSFTVECDVSGTSFQTV